MEADHPTIGEPEPPASDDQGGGPSATTARSYECSFCKRGFSNAQALGGHMNIHRKDRAKLKQPFHHRPPPFDISGMVTPSYPPAPTSYMHGESGGFMVTSPWVTPKEHEVPVYMTHGHGDRPTQLPLFVETPSQREMEQPVHAPAMVEELDLELRLGLEPPDASMGLKEFL